MSQVWTFCCWQSYVCERRPTDPVLPAAADREEYIPAEIKLLLEKTAIKQINILSYTNISEEYENYPCQVVSSGTKKKLQAIFDLFLNENK